jgi:hypothetical protein
MVVKISKESCVLCLILPSRVWLNLFLLLLSYVVNLFSKSAPQKEGCCIIVRDQYSSWGSTAALNCFLMQKSVSRMTRGRSRKRHQNSRKSTDENDHPQTGQGEEIATPPAWCTSSRRGRPEEFTEMNPSNPLQTEEPGIGNDSYYAASAVSPNANLQVPRVPLFTVDRIAGPLPTAAQTLEDQYCEEPESQELFHDCLTPVCHRDIRWFARQLEEYSNEAHLSAVMAAIQYSEEIHATDEFTPDFEGKDDDSFPSFRTLQRPPSSWKISLERFLTVQSSTGHLSCAKTLNFVFVHVQVIPDHGGKK